MSDPQTDFRMQMTEVRRTQILMGAAQVFAKKGFHKASTKEIAKTARVSEGTIWDGSPICDMKGRCLWIFEGLSVIVWA